MANILYPDESYRIVGACFAVYNDKGCGFLEDVYQECLGIEFSFENVPYHAKPELALEYRGRLLVQKYKPDFVCFDKIIVEIKAVSGLGAEHRAQVINYLHATGKRLGILVNFGNPAGLKYERFLLDDEIAKRNQFRDVSNS